MSVRIVEDNTHFQNELIAAAENLVVVDFTATWCGPCKRMAPFFELLSTKFPKTIFLKVDVDKCQETAVDQDVQAMPTFIFYKNQTKIDFLQGANFAALEAKLMEHEDNVVETIFYKDHTRDLMELNSFVVKKDCECLNESDEHTLLHVLSSTDNDYLQSNCDEQLIMSFIFHQQMKIYSLKFKAPTELGPREIRIFINQPKTIDFELAESMNSVQELTLGPENFENEKLINLEVAKFQNVKNIQIYVRNNQTGNTITQIDYIGFIGIPLMTAKMEEFKRVADKAGVFHSGDY